jgi:EmrB/QacA subfamily drug resistance transporter
MRAAHLAGHDVRVSPDPRRTVDPKWWTLAAVCLGTFMLLLDITIVNVALPSIQQDLDSSFSDLQWVVDAYALTLAALLLTGGSLADMFGRRKLYVAGLVVFTLASVLCGLAQSPLMLELSRGLQGVGGAVMFAVSLALLAQAFRGRERGLAFGVWGAVTGVAVAIGPLLGGALVSGISWRWIFFVNVPLGAIALTLTMLRVVESRDDNARRPDWPGFVLFTAGLASLIYGLIESGRIGFSDSEVIACFAAAAVLLVAFVFAERRSDHPMFDLALFRKPTFSGGAVAAFGISASIFSMLLYLTIYLQDVLQFSALETGLRLLVLSGAIFLIAAPAGRLTSHVPIRLLIGPGLLLVGVGLLLMRGLDAASSWTHLIPGLIVGGVGVGLINPPLASTAVGVVQPQRAGMASGINSTFRQIGIATGIALLGTLFSNRLRDTVSSAVHAHPVGVPADQITSALQNGQAARLFAHAKSGGASDKQLAALQHVARGSFTTALDHILLVAAIIALVCGVLTFVLIRQKDFVQHGAEDTAPTV